MTFSWKCADRRYLIRLKGSSANPQWTYQSQCLWYKNYSITPSDLECVITYCDNPITSPNDDHNYNYNWNGNLVRIGQSISYPCMSGHRLEQNTQYHTHAAAQTLVQCGTNGNFTYPSTWTQCSVSITCEDPGNSEGVTRNYIDDKVDLIYKSQLRYICDDNRSWIKKSSQPDTSLASSVTTMCEWRKTYPLDGSDLVCVIHHCRHPHNDPGSHDPPPTENQISLVNQANWDVAFGSIIKYRCADNTYIENDQPDKGPREIDVACIANDGVYNTPVLQGNTWPNCTETVVCGQPPQPPVNGTRTWLSPAAENQETYNTGVEDACQDGSQFDTDGDGVGDQLKITTRCLWNKAWSDYPTLPDCIVTHCVEPFKIPEETSLEEVTSDWTPINEYKQYRCKNQVSGQPTMFWESDRTKYTFKLICKPDGYFTWEEWPICLTDIECAPLPPEIPTNSEYLLASDDGTVTINSLVYPVIPVERRSTNLVKNSSFSNLDIPRNYMANLT